MTKATIYFLSFLVSRNLCITPIEKTSLNTLFYSVKNYRNLIHYKISSSCFAWSIWRTSFCQNYWENFVLNCPAAWQKACITAARMITEPISIQSQQLLHLFEWRYFINTFTTTKFLCQTRNILKWWKSGYEQSSRAYSCNGNSRSLSNVTSLCHPLLIPYPCEPLQPCSPENTILLLLGTSHAVFETTLAWPWDWHLSDLLWLGLSWSAWSFALTFLGGKRNFLRFRWLQPDMYLNNFGIMIIFTVRSNKSFSEDRNIKPGVMV